MRSLKAFSGRFLERYKNMPLPMKAGVWFTICSILQRGISVLSMPIFTRLLNTDQFGEYNLYISWSMILSLVVTLNIFAEVFNKGLSDYKNDRDHFTSTQIGLLTSLVIFFLIMYVLVRETVKQITGLSTTLTLLAFLEVYVGGIIGMWYARKRFDYSYRPLVAIAIMISLFSVILGVFGVIAVGDSDKVLARVVANVIPSTVVAMFVIIFFLKKSGSIFNGLKWKQTLALSIPLVPHYLSQVLLNQSDKVMIGWFSDATSVAIYSIAHSAGLILIMVNTGIHSAFVPWSYEKLKAKEHEQIARIANPLCFLVLVLNFMLVLVAPEAVFLLATPEYANAMWCIPPIATSVVFCFFYALFSNIEIYYGRTKYVAIASVFAAVMNIVLNFALIPQFGYIAAAYTTAISYFATMMLHYMFMRKVLIKENAPPVYNFSLMLTCCGIMVVLSFCAALLYDFPLVRFVIILLFVLAGIFLRGRLKNVYSQLKKGN